MNKKTMLVMLLIIVLIGINSVAAIDSAVFENKKSSDSFNKLDVIISDISKPDVELYFYGRESSLKIAYETSANISSTTQTIDLSKVNNDKLIQGYSDGNSIKYYQKEDCPAENGCFEYELIIYEIPKSNIFSFKINSTGLTYYYQPPMNASGEKNCNETSCWTVEGKIQQITDYRPENIAGSYVVFGDKRDNQYMTGKLFNIYRPLIIDNNNKTVWGELNIKDNLLTITVDQKWLDGASYPVSIDPTFGKTSTPGSSSFSAADANEWFASNFTSPANLGIVNNCSAYVAGDNYKMVLVLNSNLTIVSNGVSNAKTVTDIAFNTFTFTSSPSMSASTNYALGFIGNSGFGETIYYDALTAGNWFDSSNSYTTPANPTDASRTSLGHRNFGLAVYCSYTVADTTAPVVNIMNSSFSTTDTTPDIYFNYTDAVSATADCDLYFNASNKASNTSVLNNTKTFLTSSTLSAGSYTTYVGCADSSSNVGNSTSITVNITAAADSCTYGGSGTWYIAISDNCILNTQTIGSPIVVNGSSGSLTINGTVLSNKTLSFTPSVFNGGFVVKILKGFTFGVFK
jgi:hypothetical protein